VSDIAEDPETAPSASKEKANRIDGIVGDGEGFDLDFADSESGPGFELLPDDRGFDAFPQDSTSMSRRIDGDFALPAEDFQPAGMIPVLMSEDYGGDTVGVNSQDIESRAELACREPGIDEDAGFIETDKGTVAGTAAAENRQM